MSYPEFLEHAVDARFKQIVHHDPKNEIYGNRIYHFCIMIGQLSEIELIDYMSKYKDLKNYVNYSGIESGKSTNPIPKHPSPD
jgi:hypothetical protein